MNKLLPRSLAAVAVAAFLSLPGLVAQAAGSGSGTHGGKMSLCFFKDSQDGRYPDYEAGSTYFYLTPDGEPAFKPGMRAEAKGKFMAYLLEVTDLRGTGHAGDLLNREWAKLEFEPALTAMHNEFRKVPKFYRLLLAASKDLPRMGNLEDPAIIPAWDGLPSVPDAGIFANPPANCVPMQAAMRFNLELKYDPMIWEGAANAAQRALLQLHEEIFYLGERKFRHKTSELTQQVIHFVALGKVRDNSVESAKALYPPPTELSLLPSWNLAVVERARENDLAGLLSYSPVEANKPVEVDRDHDLLGYYPTLGALNSLRDGIQHNILALHGAFKTLDGYCGAEGQPSWDRKLKKTPEFRAAGGETGAKLAHLSLAGIVSHIQALDVARDVIQTQIKDQNQLFPLADYKTAEGKEDPEVILEQQAALLIAAGERTANEMIKAVRDPQHFFSSRAGAEQYCKAREQTEHDLQKIGARLDELDFMWDSTLSARRQTARLF